MEISYRIHEQEIRSYYENQIESMQRYINELEKSKHIPIENQMTNYHINVIYNKVNSLYSQISYLINNNKEESHIHSIKEFSNDNDVYIYIESIIDKISHILSNIDLNVNQSINNQDRLTNWSYVFLFMYIFY